MIHSQKFSSVCHNSSNGQHFSCHKVKIWFQPAILTHYSFQHFLLLPKSHMFSCLLICYQISCIQKLKKNKIKMEHDITLFLNDKVQRFEQFKTIPRQWDCIWMEALRNEMNSLRAMYVRICRWIVLAAFPSTSALLASNSAIWPTLRKTFALPICQFTLQRIIVIYRYKENAYNFLKMQ